MRKLITSGVLALAAAALSAQGVDINGGLHTGLSLPMGDLHDKTDLGTNQFFGAHIGGHIDFNITPHHQVRGHLTYNRFPGSGWGGPDDWKNDYSNFQVGADWVYNFEAPDRGWYTIAGASVNSFKDDYEHNTGVGRLSGTASQSGKLGVRGGGGYTFTKNFSLEGTLNQVFVDKWGGDGFGYDTATWVAVSAVFRFGR
ncbi:MAG TPA: hypothetical protein VJ600_08745 [Holophagaceae bacterium]|nr:hypothetical protein [Holophagaceae bacterium]